MLTFFISDSSKMDSVTKMIEDNVTLFRYLLKRSLPWLNSEITDDEINGGDIFCWKVVKLL